MIKKETELLKRKIEDRNRLFQANLNWRIQAAIVIQRFFRSYLRLKNRGISTTQILKRKQIEDEYEIELSTSLMQELLNNGQKAKEKAPGIKNEKSVTILCQDVNDSHLSFDVSLNVHHLQEEKSQAAQA